MSRDLVAKWKADLSWPQVNPIALKRNWNRLLLSHTHHLKMGCEAANKEEKRQQSLSASLFLHKLVHLLGMLLFTYGQTI